MGSYCCSEPVSYAAVEEDSTSGLVIEVFDDLDKVPQWGAVDTEIKVPSGENTELKLAVANTDSCVGPQNKIGHPA